MIPESSMARVTPVGVCRGSCGFQVTGRERASAAYQFTIEPEFSAEMLWTSFNHGKTCENPLIVTGLVDAIMASVADIRQENSEI